MRYSLLKKIKNTQFTKMDFTLSDLFYKLGRYAITQQGLGYQVSP